MDGNRDDARRCLQLSKDALSAGYVSKASRLLDKSRRMFPLPSEQDPLAAAITLAKSKTSSSSARPSSTSSTTSPSQTRVPRQPDSKPTPPRPATPDMVAAVRAVRQADDDHYAVLGLSRDADGAAVKRAYRKLALKLHPDRNFASGADDAFKRISRAFMTLSDTHKRAHYDAVGTDEPEAPSPTSNFPPGFNLRRRRNASTHGNMDFEDFVRMRGGAVSPDELFEFIFANAAGGPGVHMFSSGSAGGGRTRRARSRGPTSSSDDDEEQQAEEVSLWQRVKPLLWMAIFVILTNVLSTESARPSFSLRPGGQFVEKYATRNGVTFFIPRGGDGRNSRLWRTVDRAALDEFRFLCEQENEREALLRAQTKRWLIGEEMRKKYRRELEKFRKPSCNRAYQLYHSIRQGG